MNAQQAHAMSLPPVPMYQDPSSVPVMLGSLEMDLIVMVCMHSDKWDFLWQWDNFLVRYLRDILFNEIWCGLVKFDQIILSKWFKWLYLHIIMFYSEFKIFITSNFWRVFYKKVYINTHIHTHTHTHTHTYLYIQIKITN
jgi:hypothetical protein